MSAQVLDFGAAMRSRIERIGGDAYDAEALVAQRLAAIAYDEQVATMRRELLEAMDKTANSYFERPFGRGNVAHIANHLRVKFSVPEVDAIKAQDIPLAIETCERLAREGAAFLSFVYELQSSFEIDVVGGGCWTPSIKKALRRPLGKRPDWRALKEEADRLIAESKSRRAKS